MIFLYTLIAYILLVYVGIRLVVPLFRFGQNKIPKTIPKDLQNKIDELNQKATSDEDFLFKAYEYVVTTYTGNRLYTLGKFWKAWEDPFTAPHGFMHCHQQNHILRTMLVKSGRFTETSVYTRIQKVSFFIHQYLIVEVGNCKMLVDPWKHHLGKRITQIS